MENHLCILRGATLFVGRIPDLASHATVSAGAVVGLEGPVRKRVGDTREWLSARSFVFDGALRQETAFSGAVGILFTDPGSEIGEVLFADAGPGRVAAEPDWGEDFRKTCATILQAPSVEQFPAVLARAFPFNRLGPAVGITDDPRLMRVARELTTNPEAALDVNRLATMIGMSTSWLQHRFRSAAGLPLRQFRKWFQMKAAVIAIKEGAPLVEAALSAGFYDQAHFTNAFREIFGLSPAVVFNRDTRLRWYIENEESWKALEF